MDLIRADLPCSNNPEKIPHDLILILASPHKLTIMTKNSALAPVVAYSVASSKEDDTIVSAISVAVDQHHGTSPLYGHIAEVRELTWSDDYFDDDENVVAVFDFDYEKMSSYYSSVGWTTCIVGSLCFSPIFWVSLFGLVPCFLNKNVEWNVRAQHVALTRDGVLFVHEKHRRGWGKPCTDAEQRTKFVSRARQKPNLDRGSPGSTASTVSSSSHPALQIPLDQISECIVDDPEGDTCLFIQNNLSTVRIDSQIERKYNQPELKIAGLRDPYAFRRAVLGLKREYHPPVARLPGALHSIERDVQTAEVTEVLRDIRDELRGHK